MKPIVAQPLADRILSQGQRFALRMPLGTFSDADPGDMLTYSVSMADGSPLPAWLHFDAATRTVWGTAPAGGGMPAIQLAVTAVDSQGQSATDTVELRSVSPNLWLMRAQTERDGSEVWISDGTAAGTHLLKDINAGHAGSGTAGTQAFVSLGNGRVLFAANDGVHGDEIWVTDGTQAGTRLLKDVNPGAASSVPNELVDLGNGQALFRAFAPDTGDMLWITDGTEAGTVALQDLAPGATDVGGASVVALGMGRAIFMVETPAGERMPWITDGTPEGTRAFGQDIAYPGTWARAHDVAGLGDGRALMWLPDDFGRWMLAVTDGSFAGSERLLSGMVSDPSAITILSPGRALFAVADDTHGRELWFTDGTVAGTHLVKDLAPGVAHGQPEWITPLGAGLAVFVAQDANRVQSLWATDGTEGGTLLLRTLEQQAWESTVTAIRQIEGGKLLVEMNTAMGPVVFTTDGTEAGTSSTTPLAGAGYQNQTSMDSTGAGAALMNVYGAEHGDELWVSDGTAAGTHPLAGVDGATTRGAYAQSFADLDGTRTVFTTFTGPLGQQLWSTDGSPAGTALVADVPSGAATWPWSSATSLGNGHAIFYSGDDVLGNLQLWSTDGTAAGTLALATLSTDPQISLAALPPVLLGGGRAVFSTMEAFRFDTMWSTDGTVEGTYRLTPADHGLHWMPPLISSVGNGLAVFDFDDGVHGDELWVTDGTSAGTRMLADIRPATSVPDGLGGVITRNDGSSPVIPLMEQGHGYVLFSADDGTHGSDLWVTDGTEAGTRMLLDKTPEGKDIHAFEVTPLADGRTMFVVNDEALWVTDGTRDGTAKVVDLSYDDAKHASLGSSLGRLGDGRVLFSQQVAGQGSELWVSDGTAAGTSQVKDIMPGAGSGYPGSFRLLGDGRAVFAADDGVHGTELWVTDGTAAGTQLVADIMPGVASGKPLDMALRADGRVIFNADDGVHGRDAWITDGTAAGTTLLRDIDVPATLRSPRDITAVYLDLAPRGHATAVLPAMQEDAASGYVVDASTLLQGFVDPNGDALTVRALAADHGTVTDLGDGRFRIDPAADFAGTLTLSYQVAGLGGQAAAASASLTIEVTAVNDAPQGQANAEAHATEDVPLTLDARTLLQGFGDVDDATLAVRDLSISQGDAVAHPDGSYTFTFPPNFNGLVVVSYSVVDPHGAAAAASLVLVVDGVNDPITGAPTGVLPATPEDRSVQFNTAQLVQGLADTDDAMLVVSAVSASHGVVYDNLGGNFTFLPDANYHGPVTLSYTVSDLHGSSLAVARSFDVLPVNDAPAGHAMGHLPDGQEDTVQRVAKADLLVGYSDADGDALAVRNLVADHASVVDAGDAFLVTPEADFNGHLTLSYDVADPSGASLPGTMNLYLQPQNDAPTGLATALLAHGQEDTPYTFTEASLLQGITDVDDAVLHVVNLWSSSGRILDNGNGQYTLVPAADYAGGVTLNYDVTDAWGASAFAQQYVVFDPVNDPLSGQPTAVLSSGLEDFAYDIAVARLAEGFTNPDGPAPFVRDVRVDHGQVTWLDAATVRVTAEPDYHGTVNVDYIVDDGQGDTLAARQRFELVSLNDLPQGAVTGTLPAATEDTAFTVTAAQLLAGFTDADGDTLSIRFAVGTRADVLDLGNGTYRVTPMAQFNGDMQILYQVDDGQGGLVDASRDVHVVAVNDTPTGPATGALPAGAEDTAFIVTAAQLLQDFSDIDGDTLSVASLQTAQGTVVDQGGGRFLVTPAANFNGTLTLTFQVQDGQGGSVAAVRTVGLAAVNDAPTGTVQVNDTTPEIGQTLVASQTLADADGLGSMFYRWQSSADGVTWTDIAGANASSLVVTSALQGKRLQAVADYVDGQGNLESVASAPTAAVAAPAATVINGTAGNDNLVGTPGADQLNGGAGDDRLDGRGGADVMAGGTGNDIYVVDNAGDRVIEQAGAGIDEIDASVSYTLPDNVEILVLTGTAPLSGTGNAASNWLQGNSGDNLLQGGGGGDILVAGDGNDTLDGGTGADLLSGGRGNDTYLVDDVNDIVLEQPGEGYDVVISAVSMTLADNLEELRLGAGAGLSGTGNALDNVLVGGAGNNLLMGLAGNDRLSGANGNDTLVGGAGADTLAGGGGADQYRYDAIGDTGVGLSLRDLITDFVSGSDRINLAGIDANTLTAGDQAFRLLATPGQAFTAAGQLHYRYETVGGQEMTVIEGNVNSNLGADFQIALTGHYTFTTGTPDLVL